MPHCGGTFFAGHHEPLHCPCNATFSGVFTLGASFTIGVVAYHVFKNNQMVAHIVSDLRSSIRDCQDRPLNNINNNRILTMT